MENDDDGKMSDVYTRIQCILCIEYSVESYTVYTMCITRIFFLIIIILIYLVISGRKFEFKY